MAERFELAGFAYAHRGLWSPDGPPENSLEAAAAAALGGYGIEIDVRPGACGTPVVFHDPLLDRMTQSSGLVHERPASELCCLGLYGESTIPSLEALLAQWPLHLPILCEIKIDGLTDAAAFAARVGAQIAAHGGLAACMSFDEIAVAALPAGLPRGQLIEPAKMNSCEMRDAKLERAMAAGVDYVAVHVSDVETVAGRIAGKRPLAAWTVRTGEALSAAKAAGAALIFEHIDPEV